MNYYIDSNIGDDSNAGTASEHPWSSFSPLKETELRPGDRVEILSPGKYDTSLVIHGSGTEENPIRVVFAPGRYDFHPESLTQRCYNISNNNEEPEKLKNIGILIEKSKYVEISGPGARIVCRAKMIVCCIDESEDISIRDLQVDYHRPTVSEFIVTNVTDDSADITIHPDSKYSVIDGGILWQGEGWSYDTGLAQELIPETGLIWRLKDPLLDMTIEELEPGKIRAKGEHKMVADRVFQLRDTYRDYVGMFIRRSSNIRLLSLDFFYLHGMGIVGQFSEDIILDRVNVAPEKDSGRTCSVWADATHFSGCKGKITYRNCIFDGAHDDAINIHGTYLQVQEVISENSIRLRFMQRQTYGVMAFNPGDEVDFVRWDSMEIFGKGIVRDAEMIDPYEMKVTFEEGIPESLRINDVLENVTWTPEVEVTGCTIKRIPTRGFLITTRKKVVVRDNHFIRMFRNGINIESDTANWFESGCVRDMTIENNCFEECGKEAVLISPRQSVANPGVHKNISIKGNTFILPEGGSAVKASGLSGLSISNNKIDMTNSPYQNETFVTSDCDDVIISNNVFRIKRKKHE